jgi:glutamate synthase (NADPH/NADH) small chain
VKLLTDEGIKFVVNTEVGKSYPTERLRSDFDAVVLCGGATWARDLPVPGRELKGVHFAMDFLTLSAKSLLDSNFKDGKYISAKDKQVVVIGGGDTGTDCVGTSLRHGCKGLVQLEIMPRPPDERAADNPWPQWPKVYKLDYGQEEAAALYGSDPRRYAVTTKRFEGDAQGNVTGLVVAEIRRAPGSNGSLKFEEVPGSERTIPADLVLLAMGFLGPEKKGMIEELGVALDGRGNVKVDANYMSTVPGVFAAGDMSRGQSLIVWAIAEGREAARGVDKHLMGATVLS